MPASDARAFIGDSRNGGGVQSNRRSQNEQASERQVALVESVAAGGCDRLIVCSHPSVVTLGRGSETSDVEDWAGPIAQSSRGGRATYHGPQQIIVYPIVDLRRPRKNFAARDVVNRLKNEFGKDIQVDLLLKNNDNSNRMYKAGIDQIGHHVPEKYTRADIVKLLEMN